MKTFPSFFGIWTYTAVITTVLLRVPSRARLIQSAIESLNQNQILTAMSGVFKLFFNLMLDCGPYPFNFILSIIKIGYWTAFSIVEWIHLAHGQGLNKLTPPPSQLSDWASPRTCRSPTRGTSKSEGMRANFQCNWPNVSEARACRTEGAFTALLCKLSRRVKFYSEQHSLTSRNSKYLRPTGYIQREWTQSV